MDNKETTSNLTPGEEALGVPPLYPKLKKNRVWGIFPTRKPYIVAKILMENRQWVRFKSNIDEKGVIYVGKKAYSVVPKAIYHERSRVFYLPVSYYHWNNPSPIVFDDVSRPQLVNPEVFKDALDTKVVQDVLKPQMAMLMIIIFILVIVSVVVGIFNAYKITGLTGA